MNYRSCLKNVLSVAVLISVLAGCSGGVSQTGSQDTASSEVAADSSASAVSESAGSTVKMLTAVTGGKDAEGMKVFEKELSKETGLSVVMEKPADYDKTLIQKLQSGEQYDLIYLGMNQYLSLIDQGSLTDLTSFIKNSPAFASDKVDPQEIKDITVDGKIYAGFNKKEVERVVALNRIQLEKAKIDYKTIEPTLDGYYKTFQALKASNTASDYYPLNCVLSTVFDIQPWMASAGLKGGVVTDDKDGKTYVPYSTDAAASVWDWLHKLYSEKLLDPACFVDKTTDMRKKMGAASQKTGCTVDWAAWVGLHNAQALASGVDSKDYEIVSTPGTKSADGAYMLTKGGASLWGIPANAKNPEGAEKILEFFASQKGGELLSIGVPGYDYTVESGKYKFTEIGKQAGGDHGAPVPILTNFKDPIGYNPGMEEALGYLKYASIEKPIANESDYEEVVGKWGTQIVKGEVSAKDGLAKMRTELISRNVCQK